MNKSFSIVINAITKGFDTAGNLISRAIGGGTKEAAAELGKLNAKIQGLEKDAISTGKTLGQITAFKKLKTDSAALRDEWQAAQARVKSLAAEIDGSEKVTKKQTRAFESAKKQAAALKEKYTASEMALHELRGQLSESGVSTKNLANAQKTLAARLDTTKKEIDQNKAAFSAAEKPTVGFFQKSSQASAAFNKKMQEGQTASGGLASKIKGLIAAYAGFFSVSKVVDIVKQSDTAIYNMTTSVEAANREFGNIGTIEDWQGTVKDLSGELKIYSESAIAGAISRTVDMTKRLGLEKDQMEEVIKRSADLGAGKVELEGAVERVTAALRGEAESAEYLGLTLNENYIKSWYEANDVTGKAWKSLTDMEKAQVRYQVFLEQSAETQGKAAGSVKTLGGAYELLKARLVDSIANNKNLIDTMGQIGSAVADNAGKIGDMVSWLVSGAAAVAKFTLEWGKWIAGFAAATVAVNIVKSLVTTTQALTAAFEVVAGLNVSGFFDKLKTGATTSAAAVNTLAGAIKTAAGAVGAFFAGWQIGAWINSFEVVQQVVQTTYAKIEEFFTQVSIKYLQAQKLWNQVTFDAEQVAIIEKAIEAEKRHLETIKLTIGKIWEKKDAGIDAAEAEAAAVDTANDQKTESNTSYFDELEKQRETDLDTALENLGQETTARELAMEQQIADIELAVARREMTEKEGAAKILEIEKQAAADRIQILKDALAEEEAITGDLYGERAAERDKLNNQLAQAEIDLTRILTKEAQAQADAFTSAADKEVQEAKRAKQEKQTLLEGEIKKLKSHLDDRVREIEKAVDDEVMSVEEGAREKLKAEEAFSAAVLKIRSNAVEEAIKLYGKDSEEYKAAVAAKIQAEKEWQIAAQAVDNARVASAQAADDAIVQSAKDRVSQVQKTETKSINTGLTPGQVRILSGKVVKDGMGRVTNLDTALARAKEDPDWDTAADGMLVSGPSHAQGGVHIEAEGGEVIISKNSTRRLIDENGPGVVSDLLRGHLPKFGLGGLVGNLPKLQKFESGGRAPGSAGPSKTVRVELTVSGRSYPGVFLESDASGFIKSLDAAKQRAI